MKKVFIVNPSQAYQTLFQNYGFETLSSIVGADLVAFTGGEDVSPHLYKAKAHSTTFNNPHRDAFEQEVFRMAREQGLPMVGICRGGQFLNVMSGGQMYQHVTHHGREHDMVDVATGETIRVTSTHHQMMKPGIRGIIIAVSTNVQSDREWYEGEVLKRDETNTGFEVLLYKNTKSLCFQPHPEMHQGLTAYDPMRTYFLNLIQTHLL